MNRVLILCLHKDKMADFVFLKDYPTKAYKKGDWFAFLYLEPIGEGLDGQVSPHMLTRFSLEAVDLQKQGWDLIRDYPMAWLRGDLLELLQAYDGYKFTKNRKSCGLELGGRLLELIAYGIDNHADVVAFVKLMFGAGYDFEIMVQIFANIVKRKSLARDFLEVMNRYEGVA